MSWAVSRVCFVWGPLLAPPPAVVGIWLFSACCDGCCRGHADPCESRPALWVCARCVLAFEGTAMPFSDLVRLPCRQPASFCSFEGHTRVPGSPAPAGGKRRLWVCISQPHGWHKGICWLSSHVGRGVHGLGPERQRHRQSLPSQWVTSLETRWDLGRGDSRVPPTAGSCVGTWWVRLGLSGCRGWASPTEAPLTRLCYTRLPPETSGWPPPPGLRNSHDREVWNRQQRARWPLPSPHGRWNQGSAGKQVPNLPCCLHGPGVTEITQSRADRIQNLPEPC